MVLLRASTIEKYPVVSTGAGRRGRRRSTSSGSYRRVYEASLTTGRDLTADLVALQLVDTIDDALELGAFTLIGAGMLGFGLASQHRPAARAWSRCSTLGGLLHLSVAGAMAVAAWTVVDVLLVAGGTIAAPTWALTLTQATANVEQRAAARTPRSR